MKNVIKQLVSFSLPMTVLILVPLFIEKNIQVENISSLVAGLLLMLIGLIIMVLTISTFIRIGKGTLAPWSPTRKLVTGGIHGYVRNPMIIGVMTVLLGEAIAIESFNFYMGRDFLPCE